MAYSLTTVNFVSAFLILILGLVLATTLSNIIKKIIKNIELNKTIEKHFNLKLRLEHTLSAAVKYFFTFLSLGIALTQLGIPLKYLSWAILLLVFLVLLFIALSLKDLFPNFLAWRALTKTQHIKIGETLTIKGVKGKIKQISFLETQLETEDKECIFVPNALILKELKK